MSRRTKSSVFEADRSSGGQVMRAVLDYRSERQLRQSFGRYVQLTSSGRGDHHSETCQGNLGRGDAAMIAASAGDRLPPGAAFVFVLLIAGTISSEVMSVLAKFGD
jgi:hypothetical protein